MSDIPLSLEPHQVTTETVELEFAPDEWREIPNPVPYNAGEIRLDGGYKIPVRFQDVEARANDALGYKIVEAAWKQFADRVSGIESKRFPSNEKFRLTVIVTRTETSLLVNNLIIQVDEAKKVEEA